ncbi:unnamed protein product [Psylliodes chrysocephalus]|uniref:Uncharacterized protein n=1 Tax=Psylliodes chrysocephalus TaxID=3402493 RepID=A0A9P0DC47_9CUCU|nr:unnamed protein product [Psylliodes chrysocephala]
MSAKTNIVIVQQTLEKNILSVQQTGQLDASSTESPFSKTKGLPTSTVLVTKAKINIYLSKVPLVVTSKEWKKYYAKNEQEKLQKEKRKQEREQKRLQKTEKAKVKKNTKNKNLSKKRPLNEDTSTSEDESILYNETSDESEMFSFDENNEYPDSSKLELNNIDIKLEYYYAIYYEEQFLLEG